MARRVLQFSLRADPLKPLDGGEVGGQQIFVRESATHIQFQGYGVDVMTVRGQSAVPDRFNMGHLGQIIRLTVERPLETEQDWVDVHEALADQAIQQIEESGRQYQLVHSHFWISGMVASIVAKKLKVPWIHTPYKLGQWVQRPGEVVSPVRVAQETSVLNAADAIIVSYLSESELVHRMAPDVPIYVVPPGVDPTLFFSRDAGPVLKGFQMTRRPVIYVGRLASGRGLLELLRNMPRRNLPKDFRLLVVGGGPNEVQDGLPRDPELREALKVGGPLVHFVGNMPHQAVATYLGASQVMVSPNQGPTLGMAVLEAMASGLPVVGTAVPGVQDWIQDGEQGYLVEPNRMDIIWDRTMELYEDTQKARLMGKRGQDKVHHYHTIHHMVQQLASVYEEVISGESTHSAGVGY